MKKIFLFLIFVLTTNLIFGWKQSTHKLLSAYACINSKLIKENLLWKLNLDMGVAQPLFANGETKTVSAWIYDGADKEDADTIFRSMQHFHNPLKIFNEVRWSCLSRLPQDMSNPQYTRNDNHPAVTIEKWAAKYNMGNIEFINIKGRS